MSLRATCAHGSWPLTSVSPELGVGSHALCDSMSFAPRRCFFRPRARAASASTSEQGAEQLQGASRSSPSKPKPRRSESLLDFGELRKPSVTGKMRLWSVTVTRVGSKVLLTRSWGFLGCKQQVTHKEVTKVTNVGRKNERGPEEVAIQEAWAAYRRKLAEGFTISSDQPLPPIPSGSAGEEPVLDMPQCMLAGKLQKLPEWDDCWVQPKLDGVRGMASIVIGGGGRPRLVSRMRKEFKHLDHIVEELAVLQQWAPPIWNAGTRLHNQTVYLDGELYIHGRNFQEITSLARRADAERSRELGFHIFDCCLHPSQADGSPYRLRLQWLRDFLSLRKPDSPTCLDLVAHQELDLNEIESILLSNIAKGYEGIILRDPDSPYQPGRRSPGLLKHKLFNDAEFEIVGYGSGEAREEGAVIWHCRTEDGKTFNVRPVGTLTQRQEWFMEAVANFDGAFLGKKLTVKFQDLSTDGVPRFPVGIQIRDYE
mmetsp:Transcript_65515/g.142892  ORF Transcript_65515/g.142892 Transcript_65515/m.142892 type:complete len:483 (-) Transcript_65515:29-1477(-)